MKKLFCSQLPNAVDVLFGGIQSSSGLYVVGHVIVARWSRLGPHRRQARLTMFEENRQRALEAAARLAKGDFEPAMHRSLLVCRDRPARPKKKNGQA